MEAILWQHTSKHTTRWKGRASRQTAEATERAPVFSHDGTKTREEDMEPKRRVLTEVQSVRKTRAASSRSLGKDEVNYTCSMFTGETKAVI